MQTPAPVAPAERIEAIDVVRGFALLGILLMNMLAFGLPFRAYFDPTVDGADAGLDFGVFLFVDFTSEGVMRALFSMLFGAGVAILASGPKPKSKGVYFKRQFLLLAFGLADGFLLLWTGDILFVYALAGILLYPLRHWRPKALFAAAGVVFAYLAAVYLAMFLLLETLPAEAREVQARLDAGETATAADRTLLAEWKELEATFNPPQDKLDREVTKFRGDYGEAFLANAAELGELYSLAYPLVLFWDALACMLLGIALFKSGVLRGARSARFYAWLAACGIGVGAAVNAFELTMTVRSGFALGWVSGASKWTNDAGRVAMALGYVGVLMIICQRGWLARARGALAAAGRMALTNYILQSVFGLFLFHGFGLGLWNELARGQLYLVVFAEWVVLLAFSVWWLRGHRYGPLEWLWRSATYGRLQTLALPPADGRQAARERTPE